MNINFVFLLCGVVVVTFLFILAVGVPGSMWLGMGVDAPIPVTTRVL